MAIQIEDFVTVCGEKIKEKSVRATGALTVRIPERPVVITFLGEHPVEGKRKFDSALQICWPTSVFRILGREKVFTTPEDFCRAIEEEDAEGTTDIDRTILEATNEAGLRSPNLLMVYFVSYNDENAGAFMRLLDRPYTTPMGGDIERFVFAIGTMTTNHALRQCGGFINGLRSIAVNGASPATALWNRTSCMLLSNYRYGGKALPEGEHLNAYSLAMDVLVMQYSLRSEQDRFSPVLLPRVTDASTPFITATLHREAKPFDQIARTLLYRFFRHGITLAGAAGVSDISVLSLREAAQKAIIGRYKTLCGNEVFPSEQAMRHFPNGAVSGADAGEDGGQDKTMGTWALFRDKYFSGRAIDAVRDHNELKEYFNRYFSGMCGCSCGVIQKLFPSFKTDLDELGENNFMGITKPMPNASLCEWGHYAAKRALGSRCFSALKEAVTELSCSAGSYVTMLVNLSGQVTPSDATVITYYSNIADGHMGAKSGNETFEDLLKIPCGEAEMASRLNSFIESVTSLPQLRMDFFDELRARLADDGANNTIKSFLQLPLHTLRNDARMHVGVLEEICEAALFDSNMLGVAGDNHFELCNTNGMDRVVLYRTDGSIINRG